LILPDKAPMAVMRDVANWKSMKVLIIGAGPAGLTLAFELK